MKSVQIVYHECEKGLAEKYARPVYKALKPVHVE